MAVIKACGWRSLSMFTIPASVLNSRPDRPSNIKVMLFSLRLSLSLCHPPLYIHKFFFCFIFLFLLQHHLIFLCHSRRRGFHAAAWIKKKEKRKKNVRGMSVNGSDFHTASRFLLSKDRFKGGRAPKRCDDATFFLTRNALHQANKIEEGGKNDSIK